jgi:CelD/BcsL family acetyltransferase involved in cellulose biosynthesis
MSAARLRASIYRPSRAPAALLDAWRALCAAHPEWSSPLLGPDFALAVEAAREDARVAVFDCGEGPVGFLAFHLRPGGFARPIGSPFSDIHALVTAPDAGLDIGEALAAAGLSAYRATGLIDPFDVFARGSGFVPDEGREAYDIRLDSTPDAYLEMLRADSPKRFKNMRRLEHKLEREVGPLAFFADTDPAAYDRMIEWKRDQFHRTGAHDVLGPDWSRQMMQQLFERRGGDFAGLMLSLYAGDVHIGSHFGVRLHGHFHPWLASTNPDYAAFSPGQTFLMQAIAAMPALGLQTYALGHGHDHYKRPFAPRPFPVGEGLASATTAGGAVARLREGTWNLPVLARVQAAGRLKRRLDHIASVELSPAGRLRGLVEAFNGRVLRTTGALGALTFGIEIANEAMVLA